jgi:acyl-CoA thioester hydrolase
MAASLFIFELHVPYAHTDQMGFVYYANYLIYFEMARAAMMREIGMPYAEMENRGVRLPVTAAHCDYRKPAHYDDRLVVASRCSITGMRLRVDYVVTRGEDTIAEGYTEHVCMAPDGKIMRPVADLQALVRNREA